MLIGSLLSFGILFLAWMVLPVKETEVEVASTAPEKMVSGRQPA